MRSRTAAAAVAGSSYEEEVSDVVTDLTLPVLVEREEVSYSASWPIDAKRHPSSLLREDLRREFLRMCP